MKTCPRCHSAMLVEPFVDPQGEGDAWVCVQCSERIETYTKLRSGAMTATQLNELMRPGKPGRPRRVI